MTQVLLVYETVPESTVLYRLQLHGDDLARVIQCHGRFANYDDDNDGLLAWLSNFLLTQTGSICYKTEEKSPPIELDEPCVVVVSGFGQ